MGETRTPAEDRGMAMQGCSRALGSGRIEDAAGMKGATSSSGKSRQGSNAWSEGEGKTGSSEACSKKDWELLICKKQLEVR